MTLLGRPELTQVPEGAVADVAPDVFVTFLAGNPALDTLSAESTYLFREARDVPAVVAWAQAHVPEHLLLAEVTVRPAGTSRRARIWCSMPDTPWAREVGADYTY